MCTMYDFTNFVQLLPLISDQPLQSVVPQLPRPSSYPLFGPKYLLLGTIYPQLRVQGGSWSLDCARNDHLLPARAVPSPARRHLSVPGAAATSRFVGLGYGVLYLGSHYNTGPYIHFPYFGNSNLGKLPNGGSRTSDPCPTPP